MPTRKQRRREQKARRHEYEYVYVDAEGREVEVDAADDEPQKPAKAAARAAKPTRSAGRAGRVIEPPSWRRVGRRTVFMAPVIVAAMMLLGGNLPVSARIAQAIFLLLLFIPFSYFTDSLAYRMYRKRVDQPRGGADRGRA